MTLPSVEAATRIILAHTDPLPAQPRSIVDALGFVTATPATAAWELPGADISVMDGYAVRSEDLDPSGGGSTVRLRRVTESAAGHPSADVLGPGEAARISTGAVLPAGADAVVPQEDTRIDDALVEVDLAAYGTVRPGRWVRSRASDIARGAEILPRGLRLAESDVAAAVAAGVERVQVHRRPTAVLCCTGDELVPVGTPAGPGRIVNSNGLMLAALLRSAGADVVRTSIAPDDPDELTRHLAEGLKADLLLTSGGISVGDHDLVAQTLIRLGCRFRVRGVAIKPGKPVSFATHAGGRVFALPGNPASSWVTFWLFVRPAVRRLSGCPGRVTPTRTRVRLSAAAEGAGSREHYVRARLEPDGTATPLAAQASGHLTSLTNFDALVIVPPGEPSRPAGSMADALVVDPWWAERRSP